MSSAVGILPFAPASDIDSQLLRDAGRGQCVERDCEEEAAAALAFPFPFRFHAYRPTVQSHDLLAEEVQSQAGASTMLQNARIDLHEASE